MDPSRFSTFQTADTSTNLHHDNDFVLEGTHTPPDEQAIPARQVAELAAERVRADIQAKQEQHDVARREQAMQRVFRQRGIRAELHKLNVYSGRRGMFKAHVDTPRSDDQVGSLVVALPFAFAGGSLAVRQHGREVLHDWAADSRGTPCTQWAAFYSDCEHEVLLSPERLHLYGQLSPILKRSCFFTNGGYLGIFLSHIYPHGNRKLHRSVSNMLKGAEMAPYEAFAALGLVCVLTPYTSGSADGLRKLDTLHGAMSFHSLKDSTKSRSMSSLLRDVMIVPGYEEDDSDVDEDDEFGGENHDCNDPCEQYDRNGAVLGEGGHNVRWGKEAWREALWLNKPAHQELSRVYMAANALASTVSIYLRLADYVIPWQRSGDEGQLL